MEGNGRREVGAEGRKGQWGQEKDEERRREIKRREMDKEDEGRSVVVLH